jgi:hypothetical protein
VKPVEVVCFFLETGERVERVVWLIGKRVVQLLRYDGNNKNVIVGVDHHIKQLPLNKVNTWIRARL